MNQIELSVIVPVYGVEKYVRRCAESLMSQTLDEGVEFIFVDDASPDRSMDIVREVVAAYPSRKVKLVRCDVNRGLPAARNTGMTHAVGKYIYHCDSDDFLNPDTLESLLLAARKNDADMVWSGFYLSFGNNEREMLQPSASSPRAAVRDMLGGSMKYNVWNKIVKKEIYTESGILFPDGYSMGEDMTMIMLAARCRSVASVDRPLYHYVKVNGGAMSKSYDDSKLGQIAYNAERVVAFLKNTLAGAGLHRELDWFRLNVKLPFLFTGNPCDLKRWREWYPEADSNIMSNKSLPLRTRVLEWCAAKDLAFIVRAYEFLLNRVYYGFVYK